MSVIIILLLVSIGIAGSFLIAFLWSVKDGQFDDQESPAHRILFDKGPVKNNNTDKSIKITETKSINNNNI